MEVRYSMQGHMTCPFCKKWSIYLLNKHNGVGSWKSSGQDLAQTKAWSSVSVDCQHYVQQYWMVIYSNPFNRNKYIVLKVLQHQFFSNSESLSLCTKGKT